MIRRDRSPTLLDGLAASLDPARPPRWEHVRQLGQSGVVLLAMALLGVPAAVLLDVLLLLLRGDRDLLLSLRHAVELAFTTLVVAPPLGAWAGTRTWKRGESRPSPSGGARNRTGS